MNSNERPNLKRGQTVTIDGRASEDFTGRVNRLEEVTPGNWYVHLTGHRLIYPAADVKA
ncbi:hypothetical protein SEA_SHARKBOY_45 [Microbacterium phage Sharkboy]|uniref:Uncharacterized protein n=3 Tax=Dismasvirus dismas TaxID=2560588 RepID=A0A516KUB9_9CAUD|nr:hypothetical protein FDJ24_gp44 [Microbacterium phage Dismas]AUG84841.1 hypothetical protein PBI_DISMAS_44 [Microbacterium phage Dismas]AVR57205.1 hypothetical protein PBI_KIERAN_44 [Microbacterium phage Kieran]QDP45281.1 hypothetical protein SEA_SHARKBOY_45 [Microbacterium phage Sharkboy]UYL86832.1 hypothetical protein SEA_RONA_44 [Microbacterium phage Rona]